MRNMAEIFHQPLSEMSPLAIFHDDLFFLTLIASTAIKPQSNNYKLQTTISSTRKQKVTIHTGTIDVHTVEHEITPDRYGRIFIMNQRLACIGKYRV